MKDKIFVAIAAGFVLALMIAAPLTYFLAWAGALEHENVGNIIMPAKTYEPGRFLAAQRNALEEAKAGLSDIYTNYIPGYNSIVSIFGTAKINLNRPVYSLYSDAINKNRPPQTPAPASAPIEDVLNVPEVSNVPDISDAPKATDAPETGGDAPAPMQPDGAPANLQIAGYSANFLKSGIYSIEVEFEDKTKTGFITLIDDRPENEIKRCVKSQAAELNRLAGANAGVNFYVYICSRFQDSEFFNLYVPDAPSLKPLADEFFSLLDPRIKYGKLKIDTLEDNIQKLFLTDHHWNAYGAYEGYCDIIEMMAKDTPLVGPPKPPGEYHLVEDAVFYGSSARTYNYTRFADTFYFYDYKLPGHEIETTQDYSGFEARMKKYLSGDFSKSRNTDHYVDFYPYTSYTKYPENKTGCVVLMLTDSYNRGMSELLGSNFDELYVFDYRFMHLVGGYNEFIESHGVTDVLLMQYSMIGIFDYFGSGTSTLQLLTTD